METLAASLAHSPELFPPGARSAAGNGHSRPVVARRIRAGQLSRWPDHDPCPGQPVPAVAAALRRRRRSRSPESCLFRLPHRTRGFDAHFTCARQASGAVLVTRARNPAQPRKGASNSPLDCHLPALLKLWSRTFEPGARAVVKATSFASDLASPLLDAPMRRARSWCVAAGVLSRNDLRRPQRADGSQALAPFRLARLRAATRLRLANRRSEPGRDRRDGLALRDGGARGGRSSAGARVRVMNFDNFLAEPRAELAGAFQHFGVRVTAGELDRIVDSPDMRTYSKAPEFAYDAARSGGLCSTKVARGTQPKSAAVSTGSIVRRGSFRSWGMRGSCSPQQKSDDRAGNLRPRCRLAAHTEHVMRGSASVRMPQLFKCLVQFLANQHDDGRYPDPGHETDDRAE